MNTNAKPGAARATTEWRVRLDCGHELPVPWGSTGPAVLGCVMSHRDHCAAEEPSLVGDGWWALPLDVPIAPHLR